MLMMAIVAEQETPREMIIKGRDSSLHFILGHAHHWNMSVYDSLLDKV